MDNPVRVVLYMIEIFCHIYNFYYGGFNIMKTSVKGILTVVLVLTMVLFVANSVYATSVSYNSCFVDTNSDGICDNKTECYTRSGCQQSACSRVITDCRFADEDGDDVCDNTTECYVRRGCQ